MQPNKTPSAQDFPLGELLANWTPPPAPPRATLAGQHCTIAPLDVAQHGEEIFRAQRADPDHLNYIYLPYGPFLTFADYQNWLRAECCGDDPLFFSILDRDGIAVGLASYLNIKPAAGSIEVGHIHFSPQLQRTTAATEAMYLMMQNVFALGYRRYEWKCNALNARSRNAALRFGFTYEGIFRQMFVVKNRNRDTAWYSIIDTEWPRLEAAYQQWLRPDNFIDGVAQTSLAAHA